MFFRARPLRWGRIACSMAPPVWVPWRRVVASKPRGFPRDLDPPRLGLLPRLGPHRLRRADELQTDLEKKQLENLQSFRRAVRFSQGMSSTSGGDVLWVPGYSGRGKRFYTNS